jgi:hypothetical protein
MKVDKFEIDAAKAAVGYGILGSALNGDTLAIASILVGDHDEELKHTCLMNYKKFVDQTGETVEDFTPDHELEVLKDNFRQAIQWGIQREAAAEKRKAEFQKEQQHKTLLNQLRESNKPHPMGTVNELAKKFNVSKSEIRRRKTDGTLADLLLKYSA